MRPKYLTVPELTELLKLSEKAVYCLAQRHELPDFMVGSAALPAPRHQLLGQGSSTRQRLKEARPMNPTTTQPPPSREETR